MKNHDPARDDKTNMNEAKPPAENLDAGDVELDLTDVEIPITPEMIERFSHEADEALEQFEQTWLKMGTHPDETEIQLALRAIHSFKGNCGFMGLADLAKISHNLETLLEAVRDKTVLFSTELSNLVLQMVDVLRKHVLELASNPKGTIENLACYLELLEAETAKQAAPGQGAPSPQDTEAVQRAMDENSQPQVLHQWIAQAIARQDLRVDLSKLDTLMNLVGELVIAQALITRHPVIMTMRDESLERASHQLQRVSQELQDVAMAVRMVPLSATFRKMIRLVHDLSKKFGKPVDFQMTGEETEVDKSIIEKIADPLVHLMRNAIDHGLETPEERRARGKAPTGKLGIEARHEGGEVWISIRDDGRGLDRDKILHKAVAQGLAPAGAELSDKQIFKFIFEPGFSTADQVTDISGRGVGLDVVKKNIEKLKGRVEIHTEPGQGTAFVLRLPLTLAIIEGMLVRLGPVRYTLPMLAIREFFRPQAAQITVMPDGSELVRVREEILPVLRLQQIFNQPSDAQALTDGILIIAEAEGQTVCIFVDEILGQQEVVIKGVPEYLGKARGVSGCSILGDGEVSLILDMAELMAMSARLFAGEHAASPENQG